MRVTIFSVWTKRPRFGTQSAQPQRRLTPTKGCWTKWNIVTMFGQLAVMACGYCRTAHQFVATGVWYADWHRAAVSAKIGCDEQLRLDGTNGRIRYFQSFALDKSEKQLQRLGRFGKIQRLLRWYWGGTFHKNCDDNNAKRYDFVAPKRPKSYCFRLLLRHGDWLYWQWKCAFKRCLHGQLPVLFVAKRLYTKRRRWQIIRAIVHANNIWTRTFIANRVNCRDVITARNGAV